MTEQALITIPRDDFAQFVAAAKMLAWPVSQSDDASDEDVFLAGAVLSFADRFAEDFHLPEMVMSYAIVEKR